ncbi:MAG TPA: Gfo/Idh/MocA family oxidoreductase [Bacteroidetes bacterium]|nr:Gfo/Idh/MocA family oxidoreductase [Bacteroidota bacterium]
MKKMKLGCLGVSGHLIKRIVVPLKDLERVTFLAIASRSKEKAVAFAGEWGVPRAYGSYEELLSDREIDAVYIPLPNHMHAGWIKKSADAGKHILCEKPLAMDAAEAQDAAAYAEKKGVKLMEGFMYRIQPMWLRARELVNIREIGKVHVVHTHFSYHNPDPGNIRNKPEYGGGALMDIGCYAISVPRFILGKEPVRLVAHVERHPEFGADRHTSAMMDFGDARAAFTVSTLMQPRQEVKIIGDSGEIIIHQPFNTCPDVPARLTVTNSLGTRELTFGPYDQYGLMFEAFAKAVLDDLPVPTPVSDAIANMRVIDAVRASEKSGGWVMVEG